jgi:beta-galactosidase
MLTGVLPLLSSGKKMFNIIKIRDYIPNYFFMKRRYELFCLVLLISFYQQVTYSQNIKLQPVKVNELQPSSERVYFSLDGEWQFDLDSMDIGEKQNWYKGKHQFPDKIQVPGCLEAQGKGLKYLPISQPRWAGTCDKPYLGTSWYYKSFTIPKKFEGRKILLNFGGIMTDGKIWLNGKLLGEHHYASVPFGFDITNHVKPGEKATLAVKVKNEQHYRHKTPENTHGMGVTTMEMRWSGIFRSVEVVGVKDAWISDVQVVPDVDNEKIICEYSIQGDIPDGYKLSAIIIPYKGEGKKNVVTSEILSGKQGIIEIHMENPRLWYDYDPFLYTLNLQLKEDNQIIDEVNQRFGMRDFEFDGKYFLVNDKPVYLRGEMVHYHWPITISPTTDRDDLREKLQVFKDHGFNFFRHHTHFPSPEYMDICDELGILCHNELNVVKGSMQIEEGHREELWKLLLERDKNHASLMVYCMGNEGVATEEQIETFSNFTWAIDTTRYLQTNSPGMLLTYDGRSYRAPIHHEFRRAGASYIDIKAKPLYKGTLRPWRIIYAEEKTAKTGLDQYLPQFVENTVKLQSRCRKLLLERVRLDDPEMRDHHNFAGMDYQGYQLCKFRDGGSFVWGIVNDHYVTKGETAEQTKKFNNATVLLWPTKWQDRVFQDWQAEIPIIIRCSHYGSDPIRNGIITWKVTEGDEIIKQGKLDGIEVGLGKNEMILSDAIKMPKNEPRKMTLHATLETGDLEIKNNWDFWIFPKWFRPDTLAKTGIKVVTKDISFGGRLNKRFEGVEEYNGNLDDNDLLITSEIDDVLIKHLEGGGRAMLTGRNHFDGLVTEWGAGRSEFNRGTIIYDHPITRTFPHEGWCDVPFAYPINACHDELFHNRNALGVAYDLNQWPADVQPIITGIPSYKSENPEKLAHLFEVRTGKGKLIITTFSFDDYHPFGDHLLNNMLVYLTSKQFMPAATVPLSFIEAHEEGGVIVAEPIEFTRGMMPGLERPYDN